MSDSYQDAKERIPKNQKIVLNFLISAGTRGATNREIAIQCGGNWSARISELNDQGFVIENQNEGKGRYRYWYIGFTKKPKRKSNLEIVQDDINDDYYGEIMAGDLEDILERRGLYLQKKGNHRAVMVKKAASQ